MFVVDYFSKYIEIFKLDNETSYEVVLRLKCIFAMHEIPLEVFSDNSLQYSSMDSSQTLQKTTSLLMQPAAQNFPRTMGKQNKLSEPYYRRLMIHIAALLAYRSTPVHCGYSPAQLLISRQLCSTVPISPTQTIPN